MMGAIQDAVPAASLCAQSCDYDEAERFLRALDMSAHTWHFRTLDEKGPGAGRNYAGSVGELWSSLQLDNGNGRGVFVVINAGGQKATDINRVRAVWADFDGPAVPASLPLDPQIVVESSSGKYHAYWLVDGMPLEAFKSVQLGIAARCGSDPAVCDLSRVMRLPGFIHHKGAPFLTRIKRLSVHASFRREAQ